MSWMAKLYETYETNMAMASAEVSRPMPISHTLQNAHINIIIDDKGKFKRASVLEKTQIILPATEKSAGRSSGEAPHPLADKIQYIAADYTIYGGKKKPYFTGYRAQLCRWCESPHANPKALAVCNYISQGRVVTDLINTGILHIDENSQLLTNWPYEQNEEYPTPLIFKVLPKENGKVDQGSALVCWTVEKAGQDDSNTWTDEVLQRNWIDFDSLSVGAKGLCFISGEEQTLAANHPAKLRHTGDKAKLISANDLSGFTFRGRCTDTKKSIATNGSQAVGISLNVTQKAHNALRWLISRQGYRNGDQIYITWASTGKDTPDPLMDPWAVLGDDIIFNSEIQPEPQQQIDHSIDIGESFAHKFNKYLAGYRSKFESNEQILVMGLNSATPGRMSVTYYREILASEFFGRITDWHTQFAWPQRHTKEYPDPSGKKKPLKKTVWPICSPSPRVIAEAAYGDILKSNDTLKKNLLERILPCIVDGRPFPKDIMMAAIRRACNRNNCDKWEWERNLGVACALYKGFYLRPTTKIKQREYAMALEENRNSRDYLYGRLLAIAEKIEEVALNVGGENRPTTAARLMQRFADRPFSTWRNIELGLQPYMQRLQGRRAGFLTNRKKELDIVSAAFLPNEFASEKQLSGEFLLGYHCQKQHWRTTNPDTIDN